jgi:hypothetical protein
LGSIPAVTALNLKGFMIMDLVKIAERIEDELLNLLAIGDITDYNFNIIDKKIDFNVFKNCPIEKINISIEL